jgi:hypothetical protein
MTQTSLDRVVEISATSGHFLRAFEGLDDPSFDIALSPNQRYEFAACSGIATMWDYATGVELGRFELPIATNAWAVFPPDSDTAIVVQDNTKQVIEWRLSRTPSLAELHVWIVKNRHLRDWTDEECEIYRIES